jgi:hypothetical protein
MTDDETDRWFLLDPNIHELNTYSQITNKCSQSEDKWKSKTALSLRQAIAHNAPDHLLECFIDDYCAFQVSESFLESLIHKDN